MRKIFFESYFLSIFSYIFIIFFDLMVLFFSIFFNELIINVDRDFSIRIVIIVFIKVKKNYLEF